MLRKQEMGKLESLEGSGSAGSVPLAGQNADRNIERSKGYMQFRERLRIQSQKGILVFIVLEDVQSIPVRVLLQSLEVVQVFADICGCLDAEAVQIIRKFLRNVGAFLIKTSQTSGFLPVQDKGMVARVVERNG